MKGYKAIEELITSELEDYSYFTEWELHLQEEYNDKEYYFVNIKAMDGREKILNFRTSDDGKKVEIEVSEDCYHEVTTYDFRVKYFWIALLSWDI